MKRFLAVLCLVLISSAFLIPGCTPAKVELPVINSFDASPSNISTGESSTLNWNTSEAKSVSIDQGIGNVALTGTRAVAPGATVTYILTATNAAGSVVATTQVMVAGTESPPVGLPVINSFTSNPPDITAGNSATLSWNVSNATSVAISPGLGTFASSGTTLDSPVATTTYILTATNEAGSTTATAQVTVSEEYTPPPPPEFAVTNVTASVAPSSFTGACPKDFSCSAVITANGAGTVTYRWERSDGGSSPTQTINFASAGSKTVTTGWPREASGAYWVRVRTLTPNEVLSNQAGFNLTCSAPFAVTKVEVKATTPTFTGVCPHNFNLVANITANGTGTVTYRWERSDGGTSPTQSITFTGVASPTTGWPLEASGSYWVRVRILTPNEMVSNQANLSLTCQPFAVTDAWLTVTPETFTGACPKNFALMGNIKVNGPGTVTYRWERSDGGASPTQTYTFESASTFSPFTTWPREASGSYWVRIHILTPNDMVSDKANFTLNCE